MAKKDKVAEVVVEQAPLRLDIGCGKNPKEGFTGVDIMDFGQQYVLDAGTSKWPWANGSVEEVHCSHFVEHLTAEQRIHFVNELYRVLKDPLKNEIGTIVAEGGKATIIVPHFSSERAYGDLTHKWPPVVGFWFQYLDKSWREAQTPHNDFYTCNFQATWGFSMHPSLQARNQEYQMHALTFWKEAAQDMIATLVKI